MELTEYLWAVVVGGIFCFTMGFGMGANDVANNFGTSIGSKSISLKKALVIAGIFELVGAVALGATVTDSVRKGIYDPAAFGDMPDLLLTSNLTALISATIWLLFATQFGLPVSAHHSIIGALVGSGLAISGKAVNWNYIGMVIGSWFVSPLLAVIVSMIYYALLRWAILRRPNSVVLGYRFLWALVFLICAVCCIFFMVQNPLVLTSTPCEQEDANGDLVNVAPCTVSKWVAAHMGEAMGIAFGGAAALTLILSFPLYWAARRRLREYDLKEGAKQNTLPHANSEGEVVVVKTHSANETPDGSASFQSETSNEAFLPPVKPQGTESGGAKKSTSSTQASQAPEGGVATPGCSGTVRAMLDAAPWNADLHADVYEKYEQAHNRADMSERFDPRCEKFFSVLQIVSAAVMSLVHGCNDVSNAAAPYASVYSIYEIGRFEKSITVPIWILVLGGVSICFGLGFLGHRVISRLGIEMFHVTPCRGFSVEAAAATVLIIGSFMGFPLSTTHCAVGAMIGVALSDKHFDPQTGEEMKGNRKFGLNFGAVSWKVLRDTFIAWVATLLVCGLLSYLIFSFAVFSPTHVTSRYQPCSEWTLDACIV